LVWGGQYSGFFYIVSTFLIKYTIVLVSLTLEIAYIAVEQPSSGHYRKQQERESFLSNYEGGGGTDSVKEC
jgi:hypothetical protein